MQKILLFLSLASCGCTYTNLTSQQRVWLCQRMFRYEFVLSSVLSSGWPSTSHVAGVNINERERGLPLNRRNEEERRVRRRQDEELLLLVVSSPFLSPFLYLATFWKERKSRIISLVLSVFLFCFTCFNLFNLWTHLVYLLFVLVYCPGLSSVNFTFTLMPHHHFTFSTPALSLFFLPSFECFFNRLRHHWLFPPSIPLQSDCCLIRVWPQIRSNPAAVISPLCPGSSQIICLCRNQKICRCICFLQ